MALATRRVLKFARRGNIYPQWGHRIGDRRGRSTKRYR